MQKLINALAITSFIVSAGVVGGGVYLYANKDAMIDQAKEQAMQEVQKLLPSLLPTPELPIEPPLFSPF